MSAPGALFDQDALDFDELALEIAAAAPVSITKAESRLLRVKAIYCFSNSIATIFLNLYLFKLGGFGTVATHFLAFFTSITVAFVLGGALMRGRSNVRLLQVGALSLAGVYLSLLALGPQAVVYVIPLGLLAGLGDGFFWTSVNLSEYVVTSGPTRNIYFGRDAFWSGLGSMLGPPLGGLVIFTCTARNIGTTTGYYALFAFLVAGLIATAAFANRIVRCSGLRFAPKHLFRSGAPQRWKLVLLGQFLFGCWATFIPMLVPVLLLLIVKGELAVGLLAAASSVTGALAARIVGRVLHWNADAYVVGACTMSLAIVGFATDQGWFAIFCIAFLYSAMLPLTLIPIMRNGLDAIDHEGLHWQDTFHRFIELEVALNTGRILSFLAILFVVGGDQAADHVRNAILVAAVVPVLAGFVQARIHRLSAKLPSTPRPIWGQPRILCYPSIRELEDMENKTFVARFYAAIALSAVLAGTINTAFGTAVFDIPNRIIDEGNGVPTSLKR